MKRNRIVLLLLACVFSTMQPAPFRVTLPPMPADSIEVITATANGTSRLFSMTHKTQKIVLNFLRLAPAAASNYILAPLWQGAKAHPFLALVIGGSFCHLLHKRYQAVQLAARINSLEGQPQVDMNVDNGAIPKMAKRLRSSWYLKPQNLIIGGLILGCLALIPEQ